jgi:glycosyltransferase involved in cell wall biosynthesis
VIKLSILTPTIPSRTHLLKDLSDKLDGQIGDLPIEHLVLCDNKRRTIGEKRDALLRAAIGEYIAFVDDDDDVSDDYVSELLKAIDEGGSQVITFEQDAYFDELHTRVIFHHGRGNEEENYGGITQRGAWHVCAWKRDIAWTSYFPAKNYGEDWDFCKILNDLPMAEHHIPKVLHTYRFRSEISEAPAP